MNVAILHYHLNRGGVNRVVENHLLALDSTLRGNQRLRVAILYGGRAEGWPDDLAGRLPNINLTFRIIPRLEYDATPVFQPDLLAADIVAELNRLEFDKSTTLLHVHNHGLAKNLSLPGALKILADDGHHLFLQIHDFAEDFRPQIYARILDILGPDELGRSLYPQTPRVHYAVLNRRDLNVLTQSGVPSDRLHFLPNSVANPAELPDKRKARSRLQRLFNVGREDRYVLYPVRGIRRKNIGEAILWSILAGKGTTVGLTLAPLNPAEQPRYNRWNSFANEFQLPCRFETGADGGMAFNENLSASDLILTTSVAEGFGMVFLESWLAGRPLAGRDIPAVTADFSEAGIQFPNLYSRLDIPVEWIDANAYREKFITACNALLSAYRLPSPTTPELEVIVNRKMENGLIDFADLDEELQEVVIQRAAGDSGSLEELKARNPKVVGIPESESDVVSDNQERILQTYSLTPNGQRLKSIYARVLTSADSPAVIEKIQPRQLLDQFLDLNQFRLLRS